MRDRTPWTELHTERVARGLSITELADLAGISRETLSRLEAGARVPSDETLTKIARALRVRPARIKRLSEPV
jgi:transcriptional regulator with XRE-family HTH domain